VAVPAAAVVVVVAAATGLAYFVESLFSLFSFSVVVSDSDCLDLSLALG
jgi:hypothetical protein